MRNRERSRGGKVSLKMRKKFLMATSLILGLVLHCSAFAYGEYHRPFVNGGTVTGRVVIKGVGPMIGGTVFLIDAEAGTPPSATKYWLVPSYVYVLDDNAAFKAVVPEGTYYIGAIERRSPEILGPPEEGDYFFISQDKKGNPKMLTVWKNSVVDLGVLNDAVKFRHTMLEQEGITAIDGVVRDGQGKPVGGMVVFAYPTSVMFGRPLFVSERSGKDGKFSLRLSGGGTYYLTVRAGYGGGPPAPDELIGVYNYGAPVSVGTKEVKKGIDLLVKKYLEWFQQEEE